MRRNLVTQSLQFLSINVKGIRSCYYLSAMTTIKMI